MRAPSNKLIDEGKGLFKAAVAALSRSGTPHLDAFIIILSCSEDKLSSWYTRLFIV